MSIGTIPAESAGNMGSPEKRKDKERKKKEKSSHGEKRKRDHNEDVQRSTSKKHRKEKSREDSTITLPSSSPFHLQTASLYLPLAPVSQQYPLEGFCAEHLSPLLLSFYTPLGGVILSYSNVRLSEEPYGAHNPENIKLQSVDEYAVCFCWVRADFLLFKPEHGVELEGYVNLQSEGHVAVVCWNLFNASIEAKRLPKSWKWADVEEMDKESGNEGYAEDGVGCWVDENGDKLEGKIKFKVVNIDGSSDREKGFLSIEGTMLNADEEIELLEAEANGVKHDRHRQKSAKSLGATDLSIPVEQDALAVGSAGGKKHRQRY